MRHLAAVAALALASAGIAAAAEAIRPDDPLVPQQWYLGADRAFDAPVPATARPVRVAVLDSGIDGRHPEFAGKIVAAKSFVGGSALVDSEGHGTFVAGEIAAAWDGRGIAGIAPSMRLVVAKVVRADGTILPRAEARAIRWAVSQGARVINLSFTIPRGTRGTASHQTFSRLEARAIAHAVRHNVVVVAAVGNSTDVPGSPPVWNHAGYPAALPHVLGVSAFSRDGSVPPFSNRDARFNDIAAPGDEIVSTLPATVTSRFPSCPDQGYSLCGPLDYRKGAGTSFATPQVSAAASLVLAVRPTLRADQVTALLEQSAADARADTGCNACAAGRDALSGWGRLDIAVAVGRAMEGRLPPADRHEPNDTLGLAAQPPSSRVAATLDYWDDPVDVYRVRRRRGARLSASFAGLSGATELRVRGPGTSRVVAARRSLSASGATGWRARLVQRAPRTGTYFVEIRQRRAGAGRYTLDVRR